VIYDTKKHVTEKALVDMPALRMHPAGSVVIAMYGATIGRLGILGKKATTNQACCVMPPSKILHNKYLFYWLYATRQEIINLSSGGGQPNVNQEKIASLKVSAPCVNEQKQIAAFLDRETQKIDRLIEKQQQLIKLLQEKRQAVIYHAVTKGLNPDAKMKDSGVEWLGDIPAHWDFKRLKFACKLITKKIFTDNMNVVALENIESKTGKYIEKESQYSGEDVGFISGDILFGKLRPYLSKVYLAESAGVAFGDLLVYRPIENLFPEYVFYQMLSDEFISTVDSSTYGSKMPRASADFINDMPFLLPPKNEQKEIIDYLKLKVDMFSNLIEMTNMATSLLCERRTALISAAVTGKIDVRNIAMDTTNSHTTEQDAVAL